MKAEVAKNNKLWTDHPSDAVCLLLVQLIHNKHIGDYHTTITTFEEYNKCLRNKAPEEKCEMWYKVYDELFGDSIILKQITSDKGINIWRVENSKSFTDKHSGYRLTLCLNDKLGQALAVISVRPIGNSKSDIKQNMETQISENQDSIRDVILWAIKNKYSISFAGFFLGALYLESNLEHICQISNGLKHDCVELIKVVGFENPGFNMEGNSDALIEISKIMTNYVTAPNRMNTVNERTYSSRMYELNLNYSLNLKKAQGAGFKYFFEVHCTELIARMLKEFDFATGRSRNYSIVNKWPVYQHYLGDNEEEVSQYVEKIFSTTDHFLDPALVALLGLVALKGWRYFAGYACIFISYQTLKHFIRNHAVNFLKNGDFSNITQLSNEMRVANSIKPIYHDERCIGTIYECIGRGYTVWGRNESQSLIEHYPKNLRNFIINLVTQKDKLSAALWSGEYLYDIVKSCVISRDRDYRGNANEVLECDSNADNIIDRIKMISNSDPELVIDVERIGNEAQQKLISSLEREVKDLKDTVKDIGIGLQQKLTSLLGYELNKNFIDPENLLGKLDSVLKKHQIAIISGEPGVGKYTLAAEYGKREINKNNVVIHINAESEDSICLAYLDIVRNFANLKEIDGLMSRAAKNHLSALIDQTPIAQEIFFIFDRVVSDDSSKHYIETYIDHVPKRVRVIVIAEEGVLLPEYNQTINIIKLERFNREQSFIYFNHSSDLSKEQIKMLVQKIKMPALPQCLDSIRHHVKKEILVKGSINFDSYWDLSINSCEKLYSNIFESLSNKTAEMLKYLSYLNGDFVSNKLFGTLVKQSLNESIAIDSSYMAYNWVYNTTIVQELQAASLISNVTHHYYRANETIMGFAIASTIQDNARSHFNISRAQESHVINEIVRILLSNFPNLWHVFFPKSVDMLEASLQHVIKAIQRIYKLERNAIETRNAGHLIANLGHYCRKIGLYSKSKFLYENAYHMYKDMDFRDRPHLLLTLVISMSINYEKLEEYDKAIEYGEIASSRSIEYKDEGYAAMAYYTSACISEKLDVAAASFNYFKSLRYYGPKRFEHFYPHFKGVFISPETINEYGEPLLFEAVYLSANDAAYAYIKAGANVTAVTGLNLSLLDYAQLGGNKNITEYLANRDYKIESSKLPQDIQIPAQISSADLKTLVNDGIRSVLCSADAKSIPAIESNTSYALVAFAWAIGKDLQPFTNNLVEKLKLIIDTRFDNSRSLLCGTENPQVFALKDIDSIVKASSSLSDDQYITPDSACADKYTPVHTFQDLGHYWIICGHQQEVHTEL